MKRESPHLKPPSQTAGPRVHIGLARRMPQAFIFLRKILARSSLPPIPPGSASPLKAGLFDDSGTPVRDVLLEIWQANAAGRYNHPGRSSTAESRRPGLPRLGAYLL